MWVESAGVAGEGSTFHATLVAGEADQAAGAGRHATCSKAGAC